MLLRSGSAVVCFAYSLHTPDGALQPCAGLVHCSTTGLTAISKPKHPEETI